MGTESSHIGNGILASLATTIAILEIVLYLAIFSTFKTLILFGAEHIIGDIIEKPSHIGNRVGILRTLKS